MPESSLEEELHTIALVPPTCGELWPENGHQHDKETNQETDGSPPPTGTAMTGTACQATGLKEWDRTGRQLLPEEAQSFGDVRPGDNRCLLTPLL